MHEDQKNYLDNRMSELLPKANENDELETNDTPFERDNHL